MKITLTPSDLIAAPTLTLTPETPEEGFQLGQFFEQNKHRGLGSGVEGIVFSLSERFRQQAGKEAQS